MTHILPLSEVKMKLSQLVVAVASKDDEIIITRNGKPAAVLMNVAEYESWSETQEIKRDPELMRQIRKGLKALQEGKGRKYHSLDTLFKPALK